MYYVPTKIRKKLKIFLRYDFFSTLDTKIAIWSLKYYNENNSILFYNAFTSNTYNVAVSKAHKWYPRIPKFVICWVNNKVHMHCFYRFLKYLKFSGNNVCNEALKFYCGKIVWTNECCEKYQTGSRRMHQKSLTRYTSPGPGLLPNMIKLLVVPEKSVTKILIAIGQNAQVVKQEVGERWHQKSLTRYTSPGPSLLPNMIKFRLVVPEKSVTKTFINCIIGPKCLSHQTGSMRVIGPKVAYTVYLT